MSVSEFGGKSAAVELKVAAATSAIARAKPGVQCPINMGQLNPAVPPFPPFLPATGIPIVAQNLTLLPSFNLVSGFG